MNLHSNDLREIAELPDRETMKDAQLPAPRAGYEFPIVTRLIADVFSSIKQQGGLLLPDSNVTLKKSSIRVVAMYTTC
ncbi:MAG: hypothetical protein M1118_07410 [Chloroflexi bacterium]|nr:hypothetical protein [Chloroflexota bacterium]